MNCWRTAAMMMTSLFPVLGYAANPFLDASNDQPVSAKFRGTEWSDDIGEEDVPVTARVVTTRIAKMPCGTIFKVELTDLKSRAEKHREIRPDYYIVTDARIVDSSHPSGHFKKIIWKKGTGLLEYASGYGAHADGYRLKRVLVKQKG
jgi:hypothetical protein